MRQADISLDDKYALDDGRILLNGTQALVRLALIQKKRDIAAGLNTAGFITGYRGSPLGGLDQTLLKAKRHIDAAEITFTPGLNEDLAATAILGTQQIHLYEKALKDGVFAMWYAKGPGVDRSGDALRHGNLAGTTRHGGVLLLAGDDHTCKSSTTSHQSEFAFLDAMIPVLNPAGIAEIIGYGQLGWALSRYSGCWTALKLIAETVDSSASIPVSPVLAPFVTPDDFEMPPEGIGIRWPDTPQDQERRLHNLKLPAALAFARANKIDRVTLSGRRRRLGIVTTGKSYLDVMQALDLLGISTERAADLGIAIYKVGLVWPLEPVGLQKFAEGSEEILVVEEKRPLLEGQVKDILFNLPADRRPRVFGKRDAENAIILPAHDDLTPVQIARAISARVLPWVDDRDIIDRVSRLSAIDPDKLAKLAPLNRTYYFCSGCPHNSSTRVPEGSRAMAGIGCSWMAQSMDRNTATYTHMGAEGANWIGQRLYVPTTHVFQNLGDGTYFHSGLLAIRAAIAAKANITYKILYNDAVAMTGGQMHDGELTPQSISHQVRAEGARRIAVVSDDIEKYRKQPPFAKDVSFHDRSELDAVQRELREVPGVSILIYDQTCAAEKRRRRKRNRALDPNRRVLINEQVCEGCGDCSVKSNCLSVVPIDTEFGRKRRIDQSSCNKDFSCVQGFCPSFVSVEGGALRRSKGADIGSLLSRPLPLPATPSLDKPYNVLITGVGGTGVVTIGAIIAMAAHIEGKGCSTLDMTGLAQKGGQVTTHLRVARQPSELHAVRLAAGSADLVIGCDLVVTAGKEALSSIDKSKTRVILNTEETITGDFIRDPNFRVPGKQLANIIGDACGTNSVTAIAASKLAIDLLGDSIATNLFMVGIAYQAGLLPVSEVAVIQAIELNGAAVEMNRAAFRLGRLAAHDIDTLQQALPRAVANSDLGYRIPSNSLPEIIARRSKVLTDYQNAAYAAAYREFVNRVQLREEAVTGTSGPLTEAVARNLFKLMAYKDEYEVARLYSGSSFRQQIAETFEGDVRLTFHLAPPILSRRDPASGELVKRTFGPWMLKAFAILAKLKILRGTPLDIFGYTAERRMERQLIAEYRATIDSILAHLSSANIKLAVEIARLPEDIRGYGNVKDRNVAAVVARQQKLLEDYAHATGQSQAAE